MPCLCCKHYRTCTPQGYFVTKHCDFISIYFALEAFNICSFCLEILYFHLYTNIMYYVLKHNLYFTSNLCWKYISVHKYVSNTQLISMFILHGNYPFVIREVFSSLTSIAVSFFFSNKLFITLILQRIGLMKTWMVSHLEFEMFHSNMYLMYVLC